MASATGHRTRPQPGVNLWQPNLGRPILNPVFEKEPSIFSRTVPNYEKCGLRTATRSQPVPVHVQHCLRVQPRWSGSNNTDTVTRYTAAQRVRDADLDVLIPLLMQMQNRYHNEYRTRNDTYLHVRIIYAHSHESALHDVTHISVMRTGEDTRYNISLKNPNIESGSKTSADLASYRMILDRGYRQFAYAQLSLRIHENSCTSHHTLTTSHVNSSCLLPNSYWSD
ncbi:hypothetical protein J6590_022884 [Homalodisca vitripennis]|nr:hypothetical protein J6590_022884 [Homalodisca vitripennis]